MLLELRSDKAPEKLNGPDKRLWRLEAMMMASKLCVVVAAATVFMRWLSLIPSFVIASVVLVEDCTPSGQ